MVTRSQFFAFSLRVEAQVTSQQATLLLFVVGPSRFSKEQKLALVEETERTGRRSAKSTESPTGLVNLAVCGYGNPAQKAVLDGRKAPPSRRRLSERNPADFRRLWDIFINLLLLAYYSR